MASKLRVLCLHGWRTNGRILQHQSEGLRKALSGADFFFLDAPFLATGPAQEIVRTFYEKEAPFFQWWDAIKREDAAAAPASSSSADRGPPLRAIYSYDGLEHSLDFLLGQIHQLGPIDVLLGFSQGAAVVTIMNAHYVKTYGTPPPWRACVLVAGFEPRAIETKHLLEDAFGNRLSIDVPSIHVIGSADELAPSSESLFERYAGQEKGRKKFKFVHEEGHKFPSPSRHRELYADIAKALEDIAGSRL
ncbi:hypothetical protein PybrP1_012508 [[Pythium] brassicae (nom. inval.)]|nr:hypothetical protein PybrP1_012508 [[Pythium] brassicae (nom. inval.)]